MGFTNRMDKPGCRIEAASTAQLSELLRLYIAYRVFYGEAPEEERAIAFIRDRVTTIVGTVFSGLGRHFFRDWLYAPDAFHQHAGDAADLVS